MSEVSTPLPSAFRFAGIVGKLRSEPNRRDIAVIVSDRPCAAAGVFTQNQVCAAPVQVSRTRVNTGGVRGIVICSGNANACTGEQGLRDAERMTALTAEGFGCDASQVLVAGTGVIGRPLPMPILEAAIPQAMKAANADQQSFLNAADAILTTDTVRKTVIRTMPGYTVAGFAKGAAMIGPNLATMLGFLFTDATVAPADLTAILKDAADDSFNCISVEGHTSTNDTVFLLANGIGKPLAGSDLHGFAETIRACCRELALMIAKDAEGAKHTVTIAVTGTRTDADARRIAKTVAESALVKTAIYGADPNWGRVVSAAGYAGVPFKETELSLTMGTLLLYDRGTPLPFDTVAASRYLRDNREVSFALTFTQGTGRCTFHTCDLTEEYVKLNADYTT